MANNKIISFQEFVRQEEKVLEARLKSVRSVLLHEGEKGRSMEGVVIDLLRSFLPSEYGLGTGFIAYEKKDETIGITEQIDIIVYDAIRGGPLARLEGCEIYPLESVYGYIEVKTSIKMTSTENAESKRDTIAFLVKQSSRLRDLGSRNYLAPIDGTKTYSERRTLKSPVSIRSYAFVFDIEGAKNRKKATNVEKALTKASKRIKESSFFTGLYIHDIGYFWSIPVEREGDSRQYEHEFSSQNALGMWKNKLIHSLTQYPRVPIDWTPDLDRYFNYFH